MMIQLPDEITLKKGTTLVYDLWAAIGDLFSKAEVDDDIYPEIQISHLSPDRLYECVIYLFAHAQEASTAFKMREHGLSVVALTAPAAAKALATSRIVGAMWLQLPVLPTLAFFVEDDRTLFINYEMGDNWTPIRLITLFNMLYDLRAIAPDALIQLDPDYFTPQQQQRFADALKHFCEPK